MMNEQLVKNLMAGIDKPIADIESLFDKLKKVDSHYVWYAPELEDIESENDEWEVHSFEGLGFCFETQCGMVSVVSFFLHPRTDYQPYPHENVYSGYLPYSLSLNMSREEVHHVLGSPLKTSQDIEQYHFGENLILGLIYEGSSIRAVSVGSKKVFSSERLFPNRFSEMYLSVNNLNS